MPTGTALRDHLNPFVTAQNHMSLLERDVLKEVIPACERFGLGMLPYFPLASGLLTGKYQRGVPAPEGTRLSAPAAAARSLHDANFDRVEKLDAFAKERDRSLLELAFGWLLSFPCVSSVDSPEPRGPSRQRPTSKRQRCAFPPTR